MRLSNPSLRRCPWLLTSLSSPLTTYPGGPVDAPLKKAAERLGIATSQVIFLWVKAKGAIIVTYALPIPTSFPRLTQTLKI